MGSSQTFDTIVVGAGIVGASTAFRLSQTGRKILLVDRDKPGMQASFGNAAQIAVGAIVPLASRRTILGVPAMLFSRNSPLKVDPYYLPRALPWLLKFMWAARKSQFETSLETLGQLCGRSSADTRNLLADAGASDHLIANDCVKIYQSEAHYLADRKTWEMCHNNGVRTSLIGRDELETLFPGLSSDQSFGVVIKDYHLLRNPLDVTQNLVAAAKSKGASLIECNVTNLSVQDQSSVTVTASDGQKHHAKNLVISAGAWSHQLTAMLGKKMPLETERGYHVQFKNPGISFDRAAMSVSQNVALAPLSDGLRVSSFVEIAGLTKPPVPKRFDQLVQSAKSIFPTLNTSDYTCWMGHRPSLPDCLPAIGPSRRYKNVFYNFGHGHLGVTLAATSAALIVELMNGSADAKYLNAIRASRF